MCSGRSRTKTCVYVSNSFETYVGFLHCAEGLYTMFAILAVRRSTKEVISRGVCGDLQKNCPGSLSVVPYTTSADEHLMPFFTAARSPRCTQGKFSSQFDRFNIVLKADFRLRWNLSTKPLDSG